MDAEAAMKRIPPHSIEAEQAVLGAMLMNKDAVMIVSEIITRRRTGSCSTPSWIFLRPAGRWT